MLLYPYLTCDFAVDGAKKKYAMYQPIIIARQALIALEKSGKPLPINQGELLACLKSPDKFQPADWMKNAQQFADYGTFKADFKDNNGKHHRVLLLYYVVFNDRDRVVFSVSSEDWLDTMRMSVSEAEAAYGKATVDEAIRRASPKKDF